MENKPTFGAEFLKELENSINLESASCPEDLAKFFVLRANAADVEGLVALYEPDAILACGNGQTAIGTEAIRRFYTELLATRPQFAAGEQAAREGGFPRTILGQTQRLLRWMKHCRSGAV